jgi:hypothetical protein
MLLTARRLSFSDRLPGILSSILQLPTVMVPSPATTTAHWSFVIGHSLSLIGYSR